MGILRWYAAETATRSPSFGLVGLAISQLEQGAVQLALKTGPMYCLTQSIHPRCIGGTWGLARLSPGAFAR